MNVEVYNNKLLTRADLDYNKAMNYKAYSLYADRIFIRKVIRSCM